MGMKHALWALLSLALAYGVNRWSAPHPSYVLDAGQRSSATGALRLDDFDAGAIELIDLHVVAESLPRFLGKPLQVRELWVRSPQPDDENAPDLELFVELGGDDPGAVAMGARDAALFSRRELPVVPRPRWRDRPSRIRLPGAAQPAEVVSGTLRLFETLPFDSPDAAAAWRVKGTLSLSLRDGDGVRQVSGKLQGRVVWR